MPFSRVRGQSRGVVVSQWTITMPHWSHALISCCFISIGVHTAEMYSRSNMYTLPSASIEVSIRSTDPDNQLFPRGRRDLWDSDAFHTAQKPRVAPINHGWSNLRRVWVGWPLDGCESAHMQMFLYTGGFGSREVLRQLRWWLGLLCSQLVWSKKYLILLKSACGVVGNHYVSGWGVCQWESYCWTFAAVLLSSLSFSRAQQAWSLSACRCWWL